MELSKENDDKPSSGSMLSEQLQLESVHHLTQWQSTQLNIGILGANTGHNNHHFIRTMTGHDHTEPDTTTIPSYLDEYEFITATEPVGHVHASNSNVIFWEMPECVDMQPNEYIDLVQIERYDVCLICQCDDKSFDDCDIWIAEQLKAKGKPVFFVKFHFGNDEPVVKKSEIDPIDRLEFQIIEKINNEFCEINTQAHEQFYLVSTVPGSSTKHDFNKLITDLLQSLEQTKMETLTFTILPFSSDIIHRKHEILKAKTFHSAVLSTACGIFTHLLPGLGLVADLSLLVQEIRFFTAQFGIDEIGLRKRSKLSKVTYEDLMAIVHESIYASLIVLKDLHSLTSVLIKILPIFAAATAMDSMKLLPVVGHIIHGSMSFLMTKYALIKILDEFAKVALDIDQFIIERNQQNLSDPSG